MKLVVVLFLALVFSTQAAAVRYDGYQVLKVGPVKGEAEVEIIKQLVDRDERIKQVLLLNDVVTAKFPVELVVSPEAFSMVETLLARNNIHFSVSDHDLQATFDANKAINEVARRRFKDDITLYQHDAYLTYDEQVAWLESAAAASPANAQTINFGKTYEGLDMIGIQINHKLALPSIWINANIHAREWITSASTLYIIDQILTGTSTDAVYLRTNFSWYILPNANPDGYVHSWTTNRMWRKTKTVNPGSPQCPGVDPNRNFDVNFCAEGASTDPCSETYCGPYPFSEMETANIRDFVTTIAATTNIAFDIHSFGQLWLVPWSSYTSHPADYDELMRVGNLAADAILATNGLPFQVGAAPDLLYVASGATSDWFKQYLAVIYSYSPEMRPQSTLEGGFDVPPNNIIPSGQEILAGIAATARGALPKH